LPQRTQQPVKDFDNGHQQIRFHHALISNQVIHDANVDGIQNTRKDDVNDDHLDERIGIVSVEPKGFRSRVTGNLAVGPYYQQDNAIYKP